MTDKTGLVHYTDEAGVNWRSFVSTLDNGWVIVVSQPNTELLAPIRNFQRVTVGAFVFGLALLVILSWFTIRHTVQPIIKLTETAVAISQGDLNRTAPVVGQDEVSILANAFNDMTSQLRDLIDGLERRVNERTAELKKAMREVREASRLKDEFLSVMSHELRTPLNAMIGYMGIMTMRGELSDDNLHMVKRTRANAERLLSLINDVLDISRIESGRLQIVPAEMQIRELVDRVGGQMAVLADEKQLVFECSVNDRVSKLIMADEDALTKIITNLAANAIKFTEEGRVDLTVDEAQDELLIEVTDTGIGIPVHMQEVVFERFRQVDGSSKRAHGGSGLGLAIVKNLCQAMNGSVQLTSEINEGSKFTVTLPLEKVPNHPQESEQRHVIASA